MPGDDAIVGLRGVVKGYGGLRPLRIAELEIRAGESLALLGLDAAMAQTLVDLITGAVLPDGGEVVVFGQSTADIPDPEAWMRALDGFGLLTDRAVLVEQFSVEQNLALPLSLELTSMSAALRAQAAALASEVELGQMDLSRPAASLSAAERARVRLGRAVALDPRVLLAEHPGATLSPEESGPFAALMARVGAARGLASIVATSDVRFARAVARDVRVHEPATGALTRMSGWRRWFS
jgi:ABC-type lipoprotein export system ATPase subunit